MRVGDLVSSAHDSTWRGIVMELGPKDPIVDHEEDVAKVLWFDGSAGGKHEMTCEFIRMLEVISESR